MKHSKRKNKFISNICNYDVLTNIRYIDRFYYTQFGLRIENESSDMVVKLLYLGQPRLKHQHVHHHKHHHGIDEECSSDSQALSDDEIEEVRAKIKTDPNMARHLAYAHAKLNSNVRSDGQFSGL